VGVSPFGWGRNAFESDFGKLSITVGTYGDMNNFSRPQPGETYGPLWMRTLIGIEL